MKLSLRKLVGVLERLLFPGYGSCYRCGRTFNFLTKYHFTEHRKGGCTPLCEACWSELTPIRRLPYYARVYITWVMSGGNSNISREYWNDLWVAISEAVMDGK
jgi:hypothetical protein